jgi:hypothetical protein
VGELILAEPVLGSGKALFHVEHQS